MTISNVIELYCNYFLTLLKSGSYAILCTVLKKNHTFFYNNLDWDFSNAHFCRCFFKVTFCIKPFPQISQWYSRIPECALIWRRKLHLLWKLLPHIGHFSCFPRCIAKCSRIRVGRVNRLSQISQYIGLTRESCRMLCSSSAWAVGKDFVQWSQKYSKILLFLPSGSRIAWTVDTCVMHSAQESITCGFEMRIICK